MANANNRVYEAGLQRPNILHYWDILNHAKLLLISVTMTFSMLGVGAALTMQPVYEATVTMVRAQRPSGGRNIGGALSRLVGGIGGGLLSAFSLGSGQVNAEALATLKSRSFLTSFIEERKLLPKLFKPEAFERDDPGDIPTLDDAYRKFRNTVLIVEEKPLESIFQLTIHWKDPSVAADWANALVAKLNTSIREAAIAEARKRIEYLDRELAKTSIIPIQQSIYRLIEAQIHVVMLAETQTDYAFKVIDPATPADPDRFIRPKRRLIVMAMTACGLAIAGFAAVWRDYVRRLRELEQVE